MHRIKYFMETLEEAANCELEKGLCNVDTKEMSLVIDMIKDCAMTMYYYTMYKEMKEVHEHEGTVHSIPSRPSMMLSKHDAYLQAKKDHPGIDEMSMKHKMMKLNEYMNELETMSKEAADGMTPEEKQTWKVRLNKILNM